MVTQGSTGGGGFASRVTSASVTGLSAGLRSLRAAGQASLSPRGLSTGQPAVWLGFPRGEQAAEAPADSLRSARLCCAPLPAGE